jgi:hypothetical protein
VNADTPTETDIKKVKAALQRAIANARQGSRTLENRLASPEAMQTRKASIEVRRLLTAQWRRSGEFSVAIDRKSLRDSGR